MKMVKLESHFGMVGKPERIFLLMNLVCIHSFCSVEQAPIAIAAITKNTTCLTITISIFNFELNELTQSTYKYRLLLLTIVLRNSFVLYMRLKKLLCFYY